MPGPRVAIGTKYRGFHKRQAVAVGKYVRICIGGAGSRLRRGFSPRIDFLPKMDYGVEYEIEGWVRVEGEGSDAGFRIQPPHMDKKYWMGPRLKWIAGKTVGPSPNWQKISIGFRNHDWHGWSVQPRFSVAVAAGREAYLDDVKVTELRRR